MYKLIVLARYMKWQMVLCVRCRHKSISVPAFAINAIPRAKPMPIALAVADAKTLQLVQFSLRLRNGKASVP